MNDLSILFVAGRVAWTAQRRYVVQGRCAGDGDVVAEIRIERNIDGGWSRGRGGMLIRLEAIDELCALLQRLKIQAGAVSGTH